MKSDSMSRGRGPAGALGVLLGTLLVSSLGGIGCGVAKANHVSRDGSVDLSDADSWTSADGSSVVDASALDRPADAATNDDAGNAFPCLSGADAGVPPDAGAILIANTQSGFSPIQHQCSWTYGYVAPGADGGTRWDAGTDASLDVGSGSDAGANVGFTLMSDYDPNGGIGGLWRVDRNVYWTAIGPIVQHGNGVITSGGYTPVEQWSVRRWTSTVDGAITITGSLYKALVGDAGNGIDARIVVDGKIVYAQFIGPNDSIGVRFVVPTNVMVGSAVDFVLDPHLKNDVEDWTAFVAQIWK